MCLYINILYCIYACTTYKRFEVLHRTLKLTGKSRFPATSPPAPWTEDANAEQSREFAMKVSEEWSQRRHLCRWLLPWFGRCNPPESTLPFVEIMIVFLGSRMLLLPVRAPGMNKYVYKFCIQFMIRNVEGGKGVGHGEGITRCRTGRLSKPWSVWPCWQGLLDSFPEAPQGEKNKSNEIELGMFFFDD